MRTSLTTLLLLALVSVPVRGQTCPKAPPPFFPGLFPQTAMGLPLQFTTDPTGGCTGMYRPESADGRQSRPWAMVTIGGNSDAKLGETAKGILERFGPPNYTIHTMADWPVVMRLAPLGDEFVATKGSVRVMVLVKNGDQGAASEAFARAIMEDILPKIPCG